MLVGTWLRDHEALAALIFSALSLALIGAFAWIERCFLQKKSRRQDSFPEHPLVNRIVLALVRALAWAERRLLPKKPSREDTGPEHWLIRPEHRKRS